MNRAFTGPKSLEQNSQLHVCLKHGRVYSRHGRALGLMQSHSMHPNAHQKRGCVVPGSLRECFTGAQMFSEATFLRPSLVSEKFMKTSRILPASILLAVL